MYKYEIIINWSEQDQVFIAKVPELLGCMAHGKTQEEAIINIKEAIELWIDMAKEFGDIIPQPKSLQVA
ncbi:type II toxin-antitoxin system HicB family antitoxin [Geminocystis sp.]|uniref:type II toxin-antitoxin system HicB family antitoxin n=1 Tax=Geminocystis sp. TaxID=2664100 RepID=UPI0035945A18